MAKAFFSIKWKEKLVWQVIQIRSTMDLADKFKPDYLLKILVFWLFENKLIALLTFMIVSKATMQPIYTSSYRNA